MIALGAFVLGYQSLVVDPGAKPGEFAAAGVALSLVLFGEGACRQSRPMGGRRWRIRATKP